MYYPKVAVMLKHTLTLAVLCLSFTSLAQSISDIQALQRENNLISQQNAAFKDIKLTRVAEYNTDFEKNPLVYENWKPGAILFKTDQKADSILLNIDAHLLTLVFKLSAEYNPFKVENDEISGFIIYGLENRLFVRKYKSDFKELRNELPFFEILFENDNYTVLKQETKRLASGNSEISYTTKSEDKYKVDINYFFRNRASLFEDVFLNKRGFKAMSSESQYDEIQDFVKEHKLKWGDEADMIKVFKKFF